MDIDKCIREMTNVEAIVNEMVNTLGNDSFGDGKIFIKEVVEAIRVRTNERGNEAL